MAGNEQGPPNIDGKGERVMKQTPDMAQGKVSAVLFRLALPMMISLFFQNLYVYVNTVYVSWLGDLPLAAVSLALPLTYLPCRCPKASPWAQWC